MVKRLIITDNLSTDFKLNKSQKKIRLNIKGQNGITVTKNSDGVIISNSSPNNNMVWKRVWAGSLNNLQQNITLSEGIKDKLFYFVVSLSAYPLSNSAETFGRINGINLAKPYVTEYMNYINKYKSDHDSFETQFSDVDCRNLKITWTGSTNGQQLYLKEVWVYTQG